jgi:hypothetical protein
VNLKSVLEGREARTLNFADDESCQIYSLREHTFQQGLESQHDRIYLRFLWVALQKLAHDSSTCCGAACYTSTLQARKALTLLGIRALRGLQSAGNQKTRWSILHLKIFHLAMIFEHALAALQFLLQKRTLRGLQCRQA